MPSGEPYRGLSRKLVLAFDVGTTYSGISYCILDPGEIPKILGVSRYPAQEHVGGDKKIPSILYYDDQGAVKAVGAEALQQHIIDQAEEENWVKLEWWKLHLRAKHLASSHIKDEDVPPLPKGKGAVQVLGDFMRYLIDVIFNKAVADGAVSSYVAPLVTSRTSKYTYGVECYRPYDQSLSDHREREYTQFTLPSGITVLPSAFASILKRGVQVSEEQEFRYSFITEGASRSELNNLENTILAYRGELLDPHWMDKEPGNVWRLARFTEMCKVVANTSKLVRSLQPEVALDGSVYYEFDYEIILLFGLTELKAQISWMHEIRLFIVPVSRKLYHLHDFQGVEKSFHLLVLASTTKSLVLFVAAHIYVMPFLGECNGHEQLWSKYSLVAPEDKDVGATGYSPFPTGSSSTSPTSTATEPYRGLSRKLVLAFDVGTTYSGVSYCILDPGEIPNILGVSRYPAQEHVGGDNKIPSILYYDRQGALKAVGAEALQQHIIDQAEEENWDKLEWWKLHLRAKHLASSHIKDEDIPPLPHGKSAVQVLGDFMRYLFTCARNYITESHASGASMWRSMENNIEFILTHPNGWEGLQQQQIRRAAEIAGLIPSGDEHASRIHLLTEGEASLYFCVTHVLASDSFSKLSIVSADGLEEDDEEEPEHQGIVIIDAGGGTIDLSAYSIKLSPPKEFKEIAPAECRLQGSVFVTQRAHTFLKAKLANSRYGSPDIVQQMKEIFDKTTKLRFRDAGDPQYIKFGTVRDKDPQYDIRSGQLKLAGEDVAKFFEPTVEAIADAFEKQREAATRLGIPIKHAFLVGGYAASDFLYRRLQQHPVFLDVHLCRPSSHPNKAVADGAVSSYIDPLVTSRTSRYMPSRADHRERQHTLYTLPSGTIVLPNAFQSILKKGVQVSEQQEFRQSFLREGSLRSQFSHVTGSILAYRGDVLDPVWMDKEPTCFTPLCNVIADTSKIAGSLRPQQAAGGGDYYHLSFDVILLFGLTELKAQISWDDMGVEKRYDPSNG
ncbi:hypothetical protein OG21DRAFT_1522180 [Imleria badia]|nr:hypothetical protein OG21DRAFT_1522180 [Imleria badia]